MARRLSNSIGIDDAPFDRSHRGDVPLIGAVFTRTRLDGVMVGKLRRDGANATTAIAALIAGTQFANHAQVVLLGGITFAGFNVADIHELRERLRDLGLPDATLRMMLEQEQERCQWPNAGTATGLLGDTANDLERAVVLLSAFLRTLATMPANPYR
ncbi:MAG: DUF99 family protein [Myxococcales bacterium]|nr:DUF99 family protein [Myxococcales bacterium]